MRCDDITIAFPYLFPILIERLNAVDIEGVEHLPDALKPPPSQKPQVIIDPVEHSEEVSTFNYFLKVRILIAEMVSIMISSTIPECFRHYLDDLCAILRVLAMDPSGLVIKEVYNLKFKT